MEPTGSGKSSVPQIAPVILNGFSVIIELTLFLSSDQVSKFDDASKEYGDLACSYQLNLHKR